MRYLIYEPDAIDDVDHDLAKLVKTDAAPWRRCPTQEVAAQVVRSRYPDAMPGPYETADDGRRLPVLLVWETARAMADGVSPVLVVEPEPEIAADEKRLKRYRKGDRSAAPFDQATWTRGVVPEPADVLLERQVQARFTGFIGEIETTMRLGTTRDGRNGLWFNVTGFGPFAIAMEPGASIRIREADVEVLPEVEPPFHQLFRHPGLEANADFVRQHRGAEDDDTMAILSFAEAEAKARGMTFAEYMGHANATGISLIGWYANGDPPEPRPGMVALFHPQFHKRDWEKIADTLTTMAKALERWIWVCECEESRWIMAMVGHEPTGEEDCPAWATHVRVRDQYIAAISPTGEWRVLGVS